MKYFLLIFLFFSAYSFATDDLIQSFERMAKIDRFARDGPTFLAGASLQDIRDLGALEEEVRTDEDNPYYAGEIILYYTFRFEEGLVVVCRDVSRKNSGERIQFIFVSITSPRWPIRNNLNVGENVKDIYQHLGTPNEDTGERLDYLGETEEIRFSYIENSITRVDFLYYAD